MQLSQGSKVSGNRTSLTKPPVFFPTPGVGQTGAWSSCCPPPVPVSLTTADLKPQRRAAEQTRPSLPEKPPAGPRPPRHGSAGQAWGPASEGMPCVAGTAEASLLGICRLTRVQGDAGAARPTPRLWGRKKGQSCLSNPSGLGPGRGHGIAVCRTYCHFPGAWVFTGRL